MNLDHLTMRKRLQRWKSIAMGENRKSTLSAKDGILPVCQDSAMSPGYQ